MKIYKMKADLDNFRGLISKNAFNDNVFDGESLLESWVPLELNPYQYRKKNGDIRGFLPGIPIVTDSLKKMLQENLNLPVEFLEVVCKKERLWIMNVLSVVDCVDYDSSDFFEFGGIVGHFNKYGFYKEKIEGHLIFKIPEQKITTVFVNDEFKRFIDENKLKGFKFEEVYSSQQK